MPTHAQPTAATRLVVFAGSAGAIEPLRDILSELPADFPAAIIVVQHSDPTRRSRLASILARQSRLPVRDAKDGDAILRSTVYVVPPDQHARVTANRHLHLSDGTRIRLVRSSANPLFETAATVYADHVVAVVLSGSGFDATDGVQTIRRHGGMVIVQSEQSARHFGMPGSAIATGAVDYELPPESIPSALQRLVGTPRRAIRTQRAR